jgi:NitT/TauT family transport system permease protein
VEEASGIRDRAEKASLRNNVARRLPLFGARLAVLFGLIALWQLVVTFKLADETVTSRPSAVGSYLLSAMGDSSFWSNLWATLEATLIAFVLASAVGIIVGISLGLLPTVERVVDPFLSAFNAMPRIALAPVFIVAFGLTLQAKLAVAFTIVVFIVITSARAGVRSVDNDIMRLSTVLGANRRQLFVKVMTPTAIPSIFGGLRLGVIYSLLGVVTAELIGSNNGIGQMLQQASGVFETDHVWGLLIVLAVVAATINAVMAAVERRLLRWQQ